MNKFSYFLIAVFACSTFTFAQTREEFQKKYIYGRDLLKEGRYEAAAQVLLPLTSENEENAFVKSASYLYAVATLKNGYSESTKSMCLQLLQRYPDWEEKDEVYYLLSNAYFEQKKYRLALQFLAKQEKPNKESEQMKEFYLSRAEPLDTLKSLQKDYPADATLAMALAKKISSLPADEKNTMLLNFLAQEFKFDISSFSTLKTSVLKSEYRVAFLFPFQLNDIDPKVSKRSNQYVLDFYEGARIAIDSLKAKGINITLFTYDTEKELTILNSITSLPELKTMDLIIGPVFPAQIPAVAEFCKKNNILNISPFSANSKIIEGNEYTYLFQPTLEIQAGNAARYAAKNLIQDSLYVYNYSIPKVKGKEKIFPDKKKVIIFHGSEIKDSLLAVHHRDSCLANGLEVIHFEKINRLRVELIRTIIGDTFKLGRANHVFAATSDEVVAANIMSIMEISRQNTPLITKADWLSFNLIAFEQFERRNVFFIHPDYYDYSNPLFTNFKSAFLLRTNLYPSQYSLQGYELTLFFGNALKSYGTYFKYGLDKAGFMKGAVLQGADYSNSFSNRYVPITRFKEKNLMLVNPMY